MRVSVVIPAYNEEKYIARCLESISNQRDQPDEVIVVNNNSTDNTVRIVEKFPVRLINEKNQGIIPARNRGFDEARYDIIARTDADCILPYNWITKIKQHFSNPQTQALSGPLIYNDAPLKTPLFSKLFFYILHTYLHHHILLGPNMCIRRSLWNRIRTETCTSDKEVHEDIDLSLHIQHADTVIEFDPTFAVKTSSRRILYNPRSFFFEYSQRLVKMLAHH